ncbi:MAG: DUF58 domain-containing protein [Thaumarchaeota archaeon]|nr:DUF58 domain-containing protein [Nitrososphaerota archaeon]
MPAIDPVAPDSARTNVGWEGVVTNEGAYALIILAVGAFVLGLFVPVPLMFVAIPVVVALGITILRSKDPRSQVGVTRYIERVRIRERESTRVRLRVTNAGTRDIPLLQVRDQVEAELRGKKTHSGFSVSLKAGATRDLYYEILGNSFGVYSLGPVRLTALDSTGLFEASQELKLFSKVAVFPETSEKLSHFAIRPRRTKPWPGEIAARRTGTGMDYYNIRQLIPGESAKRINWKASARRGLDTDGLMVNEYMAELGAEVLVIVDAGSSLESGSRRDPVLAYSAKAALSIVEKLLHDRNRVGLLTTGENARRVVPGYGRRQFDRIALSLLQLEPGGSDIRWWMERNIHLFFPKVSQIIFVSPLADANSIAAASEITRYGRHSVLIVSPSALDVTTPLTGELKSREWKVARRIAELSRRAELDRLRRADVTVIDWTTSTSLEEAMEVQRRAQARRAVVSVGRA